MGVHNGCPIQVYIQGCNNYTIHIEEFDLPSYAMLSWIIAWLLVTDIYTLLVFWGNHNQYICTKSELFLKLWLHLMTKSPNTNDQTLSYVHNKITSVKLIDAFSLPSGSFTSSNTIDIYMRQWIKPSLEPTLSTEGFWKHFSETGVKYDFHSRLLNLLIAFAKWQPFLSASIC